MFALFRRRAWITPGGPVYTLLQDMAAQPHLLIAGATGSGKSVLLRGIIHTLLHDAPTHAQLILVDPKRVELARFGGLPHTLQYASSAVDMIAALEYARRITDERYTDMQRRGDVEYNGPHVYVIIDELAALLTTQRRAALPILQYLGMVARAARVHIIGCTQTVKADVLPTPLTCNFDARVALRTATRQQSRMIIDCAGAELLPSPRIAGEAHCLYRCGADISRWRIPMITDTEINTICEYWCSRECRAQ